MPFRWFWQCACWRCWRRTLSPNRGGVEPPELTEAEALEADIASIAETTGHDVDVVRTHIEFQVAFSEVITELGGPDRFAWYELEPLPPLGQPAAPGGTVVTLSTDDQSVAALEELQSLGQVTIRNDGEHTLAEMTDHGAQLLNAVASWGFEQIEVMPNRDLGLTVELTADDAAQLDAAGPGVFADVVPDGIGIDIAVVPARQIVLDAQRGGSKLFQASDPAYYCTTAFAVYRPDGTDRGILTAGHCWNYGTKLCDPEVCRHEEHDTGIDRGIYWRDSVYGSTGDWAWFTTGFWEAPRYWGTKTTTRPANGWVYPMPDQWVCNFGRNKGTDADGKTCHTTESPGITRYTNNTLVGSLVRVGSDGQDQGDSGGPWFMGWTAYGVHQGSDEGIGAPGSKSYYTPVHVVLNAANVVLIPNGG